MHSVNSCYYLIAEQISETMRIFSYSNQFFLFGSFHWEHYVRVPSSGGLYDGNEVKKEKKRQSLGLLMD